MQITTKLINHARRAMCHAESGGPALGPAGIAMQGGAGGGGITESDYVNTG